MHPCILSLAANCEQEKNLAEARRRLSQILFSPSYTEAIWTEPYHLPTNTHHPSPNTQPYLNQLVYAETPLSVENLEARLKSIELSMGRTAEDRQRGIVRIDLDLMQYDDQRYHLRDWDRPYIQQLFLQRIEHQ